MAVNQLILDNLQRGRAAEGEMRANVGNPNQRLVWRGGRWEDAGAAPAGTNQMILDNVARGAAAQGEVRANVGNPGQALQWRKGVDGVSRWESDNVPERGLMSAPAVKYDDPSSAGKPAGAMAAPAGATVDASYKTPLQSRMEALANPFDANYQNRMAGQGISNAERQYSQAAQRARAALASRGLMSGGGTGLEASLLNQAAMETAGARERALTGAALDTATRGADFEFRRAGAIDAYNRGLMSDAQALSLLPSQVSLAEAQARLAGADAKLAEDTLKARTNAAGSAADLAAAQVDIARADAKLKAMTPEEQKQIRDAMIKKAVNDGIISEKEVAAADQLLQRNANEWPEWGKNILRGGLVLGGAALGGLAGFFAGGVGAIPGALAGGAAGAQAAGAIR